MQLFDGAELGRNGGDPGFAASLGAVGVSASLMPSVWAAHLQSGGSYLVAACDAALPLYCVEDTTP